MLSGGVFHQLPRGWEAWAAAWQPALECWSRFTRLHAPAWCMTSAEAHAKGMPEGIFAMIRLVDHEIVISLSQIELSGVNGFPKEILAHEIATMSTARQTSPTTRGCSRGCARGCPASNRPPAG